jgi:hypothetical protein
MKHKYLLIVLAGSVAFGAHAASARTLQVGGCTDVQPNFPTIQAAVNAAFAGDIVAICPGDYPEQVVITRSLSLRKVTNMASPAITVPAGGVVQNTTTLSGFPAAAQILIQPDTTADVDIKNIVVDGAGNNVQTCGLELIGVYYRNAGGSMVQNAVKNQMLPDGYQGCQSGLAIYVSNETAGTHPVNITLNTVTNFDKNGITMNEAASTGSISKNTVVGMGPTDLTAQNGIQVAFGANASVTSNNVSQLIYTPESYGSSAILLYGTDTSTSAITKNKIDSAQYGVALDAVNGTSTNMVQVTGNKISNAAFAGVGLYTDGSSGDYINVAKNTIQNTSEFDAVDACSNYNTITGNKITNTSGESAIHLDGLCGGTGIGNTVSGNKITVACVGILSGPPEGENSIGTNKFADVTNPIVYGQDSYSCGGPKHVARHGAPRHHQGAPATAALRPFRG